MATHLIPSPSPSSSPSSSQSIPIHPAHCVASHRMARPLPCHPVLFSPWARSAPQVLPPSTAHEDQTRQGQRAASTGASASTSTSISSGGGKRSSSQQSASRKLSSSPAPRPPPSCCRVWSRIHPSLLPTLSPLPLPLTRSHFVANIKIASHVRSSRRLTTFLLLSSFCLSSSLLICLMLLAGATHCSPP